jgi:hypothetical protein
MATGQAKLFGTIQMTNFANIYRDAQINGVRGDSLGKSNNAVVNGIKAFIGTEVSIAESSNSEATCSEAQTAHYVGQLDGGFGGEINTETIIFDNFSGFTQSGLAGKYVKQENVAAYYQVDNDYRARDGYFLLNYVTDCA